MHVHVRFDEVGKGNRGISGGGLLAQHSLPLRNEQGCWLLRVANAVAPENARDHFLGEAGLQAGTSFGEPYSNAAASRDGRLECPLDRFIPVFMNKGAVLIFYL